MSRHAGATAKPRSETLQLKPKSGKRGATTWKAGLVGVRWASERRRINLRDSMNEPGPVILIRPLMLLGYELRIMTESTAMHEQERVLRP